MHDEFWNTVEDILWYCEVTDTNSSMNVFVGLMAPTTSRSTWILLGPTDRSLWIIAPTKMIRVLRRTRDSFACFESRAEKRPCRVPNKHTRRYSWRAQRTTARLPAETHPLAITSAHERKAESGATDSSGGVQKKLEKLEHGGVRGTFAHSLLVHTCRTRAPAMGMVGPRGNQWAGMASSHFPGWWKSRTRPSLGARREGPGREAEERSCRPPLPLLSLSLPLPLPLEMTSSKRSTRRSIRLHEQEGAPQRRVALGLWFAAEGAAGAGASVSASARL